LKKIFSDETLLDRNALRSYISENSKSFLAPGFKKANVNQGFVGLGG